MQQCQQAGPALTMALNLVTEVVSAQHVLMATADYVGSPLGRMDVWLAVAAFAGKQLDNSLLEQAMVLLLPGHAHCNGQLPCHNHDHQMHNPVQLFPAVAATLLQLLLLLILMLLLPVALVVMTATTNH